MRLPPDAVRAALLHPNKEVRSMALEYFGEGYSLDPEVMPAVMRAAEQFGVGEIGNHQYLRNLKHSPDSLRWLAAQIASVPQNDEDRRWKLLSYREAILNTQLSLLASVASELESLTVLDDKTHTAIRARVALVPVPSEELWARLETECATMDALEAYPTDERMERVAGLTSALVGNPAFSAERAIATLRDETRQGQWLEIFAVRLVRLLRLAEAIPELVTRLEIDDDAMCEEAPEALCAIGTDAVIDSMAERWNTGAWGYKFSVSHVLGGIHTEKSLAVSLDFASHEQGRDQDLQCRLYEAATLNFDTSAIEPVRRFLLTAMPNPEVGHIRDCFLVLCELTGERVPELERWKIESKRDRERVAKKMAEWKRQDSLQSKPVARTPDRDTYRAPPPDTIVRDTARIGRNDPCLCGSGKKFKKCCGKNRPEE